MDIIEESKEVIEEIKKRVSRMTPQERRERLVELNKFIEEYYEIINTCPHKVIKQQESAWCLICGRQIGWWCPDSPNNICYYHSEKFDGVYKVRISDGTLVDVPKGYNPECETDDWCIFCGNPLERP